MPTEVVTLIAAALAAGGSIASSEISSSSQNKLLDKQIKAQQDAAAQQAAAARAAATPDQNDPTKKAQIATALGQLRGQTGEASVAPEFYTTALNTQFPGWDQMVGNIVTGGKV